MEFPPMYDDDFFDEITPPNPDAALFRLIAKRDRLLADGAEMKARGLFWELVHRNARTAEGHRAKIKMVATTEIDACDVPALLWALGTEAGRLGINTSMPILRSSTASRMAAVG
jgi:hypothetical protein